MKKQRKLIGIIGSQMETGYQAEVMSGISEIAFTHDYDIAVFAMFVKQDASKLPRIGEMNIYNLTNFDLLDGIIVLSDTLKVPGLIDRIMNEIHNKFHGPVISLDYPIDGCINLELDDTKSLEKMTDHLIDCHHVNDIAIMTGPKTHPHSIRRLQGYLDSLKKHNLPIDTNKIYYGDFWYDEGQRVVDHMIHELSSLPQAIVCTNDTMAVSICSALKKYKLKVPDDILVTGYDCLACGTLHDPTITSMTLNSHQLGINAMTRLREEIEHLPVSPSPETISDFLLCESCGCNTSKVHIDYSKLYRTDTEYISTFYNAYNYMMEELISSDDLNTLLRQIAYYTYQLGTFDHFYLCLCENWDYVGCSDQASKNYNVDHYTSKMHLVIEITEETKVRDDITFPSSIMLPELWADRKKPSSYFFTPVHFNDRCFGYTVITYSTPRTMEVCYRDWLRTLGIAFENLRVKNNFKWSNEQLKEFAQVDSLTKIFNRNGYTMYRDWFYETALKKDQYLMVLIGDLNDLKSINDNYGHIEGDNALQMCALAFQRVCSQNEKCFRYGGDEFVLLGVGNYDDTDALTFEKGIQTYLHAYNEVSEKPYQVNVSIGHWYGYVDTAHVLDDFIKLADKTMFKIKHKEKRYIKKDNDSIS